MPEKLLAIDTEVGGLDFQHGAKPFFITTCDQDGNQKYWEWDVNPLIRQPSIPKGDVEEIRELIFGDDTVDLILQNAKFDIKALGTIMDVKDWPWYRTQDTLICGHLLASSMPHDLTSMALQYLGIDIEPHEKNLKEICNEARRWARSNRPNWRIASAGLPEMPSAKGECWKFDMWLPRAITRDHNFPKDEKGRYASCLSDYSNSDSAILIPLWKGMEEELYRRKLWNIYNTSIQRMRLAWILECNAVTISGQRLQELQSKYRVEADEAAITCIGIARDRDYELELPRGGVNNSLREFMFDVLQLPPVHNKKAKSDQPTLDRIAMNHYMDTLPENSQERMFISCLLNMRARNTAITYMEGYRRFWVRDLRACLISNDEYYKLYPSLNPTGSATLRWTSSNPNEQNIAKREGFNLRYCFGPAPDREWWSLDAKNIELRIPAYESGEQDFIALFEKENEGPYYGSNHLLIAHLLYKQLFDDCRSCRACKKEVQSKDSLPSTSDKFCLCTGTQSGLASMWQVDGRIFKKRYASTYYQWVKNGDFAVQYGAVDREDGTGTADRAYHLPGAQARIKGRFKKLTALNDKWIKYAEEHGYVETLPDSSVDPHRGYPVMVTRSQWGKILPTVPLNYHIQSTAMWWTMQAMIRCQQQLDDWKKRDSFSGFITMQVHDEIVFDLPKTITTPKEDYEREKTGQLMIRTKASSNLWRIRRLQKLMESCGDGINVPTPVGVECHSVSWDKGETF